VFDRVAKPFFAYLNPIDLKVLNLEPGDVVELQSSSASGTLSLKSAAWVRQGSVVINDLCSTAPANALMAYEPIRISLKKLRSRSDNALAAEPAAAVGGAD
jgi:hypothetical protein